MGFITHSVDNGHVPTLEYLPCDAIQPKIGLAMTLSGGKLVIAAGTTKPTYICMTERDAAVASGDPIPCFRILPEMVFETTFSAAATSLKLGNKVTIASTGDQVTATTTDGVAEIVEMDGTAAGAKCRVRLA